MCLRKLGESLAKVDFFIFFSAREVVTISADKFWLKFSSKYSIANIKNFCNGKTMFLPQKVDKIYF
jgi:hypothetical protein